MSKQFSYQTLMFPFNYLMISNVSILDLLGFKLESFNSFIYLLV